MAKYRYLLHKVSSTKRHLRDCRGLQRIKPLCRRTRPPQAAHVARAPQHSGPHLGERAPRTLLRHDDAVAALLSARRFEPDEHVHRVAEIERVSDSQEPLLVVLGLPMVDR